MVFPSDLLFWTSEEKLVRRSSTNIENKIFFMVWNEASRTRSGWKWSSMIFKWFQLWLVTSCLCNDWFSYSWLIYWLIYIIGNVSIQKEKQSQVLNFPDKGRGGWGGVNILQSKFQISDFGIKKVDVVIKSWSIHVKKVNPQIQGNKTKSIISKNK